jgi:NADH dehydrogenase
MVKVVVIGGGYGGLRAIETLAKYKYMDITLLDKNSYHYLQTEAYGYIAGKFDVHDIAIDLADWSNGFKNVRFLQYEVSQIDFEKKSIETPNEKTYFDYLIIATGAKTNFFSFIEGLRDHSYGVKNLHRAFEFRKNFEDVIYKKLENSVTSEPLNIAIGGAGLSGVEVAAEMAYVVKTYSKTIGTRAKDVKIYLIDASSTILPGSNKYLIKNTQKRLEKLDVIILTDAFISSVDKSQIHFKDGKILDYYFMVFTGGIKASPFNDTIDWQKNRMNQFIPDKTLNILGKKNIFAIGDCVELRDKDDNILPPTAQSAERSAEYVAKAIIKRVRKKEPKEFSMKMMGVFIALGGKYAVGELFRFIKVQGYCAYLLKKAIAHAYYLGLRLRINSGYKNRITSKK